ncbi:MAG: hypothetical protein R3345_12430, partial [Fulvivirga sp.]|nr:hypothetical protein [Fulvivirga sp.]
MFRIFIFLVALLPSVLSTSVSYAQSDPLLDILEKELNREWEVLSQAKTPAYYISYRVDEVQSLYINASDGSLLSNNLDKRRMVQASVRVGDYLKDDTREINGAFMGSGYHGNYRTEFLPLDNVDPAIQQTLWRITNQEYKTSAERYKQVINQEDQDETETPDFSQEKANVYIEPAVEIDMARDHWLSITRKLSKRFIEEENIE